LIIIFLYYNHTQHQEDHKILKQYLYFQSHIAGQYNQNNWNEENYEYFKKVLDALINNGNNLNFKTFSELC